MKVQSTFIAFSGLVSLSGALPAVRRDSNINDPAVAAPNGTLITLTPTSAPTGIDNSNSNSYGNSYGGYNSGNSDTTSMDNSWTMTDSTSTMMVESTSTMMADSTSTMMADSTTVNMYQTMSASDSMTTADATSTWTSSSSSATYGSGYMPSSYDSCVQQCMASYGPPPSMVTATPSYPPSNDNNSPGSGATHTVIVAPTQGVLRYVPFAVNASVGDTVRFVWGAGPHTVTKSSEFNLCNATSDKPFKSGPQNKSFVFDQVVNDTNPVFYYCGIPNHCEKGMFGIINPPSAEPGASTSAQSMMEIMAANNSNVAAQWSYTMMNTQNSTSASNWGASMDIAKITNDPDGQLALIQNVMFTRLAMSQNPQFVSTDGAFNPDIAQGMSIPMDPAKLSTNGTSSPSNSGSDPYGSSNSSPSGSGTSAPPATASTSGASRRVASSATAVFAAVAIAALVL